MRAIKNRVSKFGSKAALLTAALIVLVCGAVGGTLAWLYFETEPVSNTFDYGDISISLTETDTDLDNDNDENTNVYVFAAAEDNEEAGYAISKDPVIEVAPGSEACWLFVRINESDNFRDYFTYDIEEGWEYVQGQQFVLYREVETSAEAQSYSILLGNTVHAKGNIAQSTLDALDEANYPTIAFKAYAVQKDDSIKNAAEAWELVK